MPFRARVKKVFGRSGSGSPHDSSSLKQSKATESNVYGPDEPIPKSKYRGPVDSKHKETLEAFSFSNAFRRKSTQSLYSPFGSRMPSRNNSLGNDNSRAPYASKRRKSQFGQLTEDPDDAGAASNVGGTRNHSISDSTAPSGPPESSNEGSTSTEDSAAAGAQENVTGPGQGHRPFTEAEVTAALEKSMSRPSHP